MNGLVAGFATMHWRENNSYLCVWSFNWI